MEGLVILGAMIGLYFLPTMIAAHRKVPSGGSVLVINLFLGWTLIGWVVALAMAARTVPESHLRELEARRQPPEDPQAIYPPPPPPPPPPAGPMIRRSY